jgi:hypothetical protein
VPAPERLTVEPYLIRWRPVYPVASMELSDQSVVYCGAPEESLHLIRKRGRPARGLPPGKAERRAEVRVQLEWPSQYQTHGESKQTALGHTIDWSRAGVSFTTDGLLSTDTNVTLHVAWPIRLAGDVAVQFRAHGRVVRVEETKAAMQVEEISFAVLD